MQVGNILARKDDEEDTKEVDEVVNADVDCVLLCLIMVAHSTLSGDRRPVCRFKKIGF